MTSINELIWELSKSSIIKRRDSKQVEPLAARLANLTLSINH